MCQKNSDEELKRNKNVFILYKKKSESLLKKNRSIHWFWTKAGKNIDTYRRFMAKVCSNIATTKRVKIIIANKIICQSSAKDFTAGNNLYIKVFKSFFFLSRLLML